MATSVSVTTNMTTPVQLASGLKNVQLQNLGDQRIFVGGSTVTAATGYCVPPGTAGFAPPIGLTSLESLYAIVDSAAPSGTTCDVRVLTYLG